MVYADYNYYNEEYCGTLPENSFKKLVLKASREIDKNVNIRLNQDMIDELPKEAQEQLKYTTCALIDLIFKKNQDDNKKISSFSIDGVSKTYKVLSDNDFRNTKKDILKNLPIELTRYI